MKKIIIILVVLLGTVSYSQNSKRNKILLKEAILEYNHQFDSGPVPPMKFYGGDIVCVTFMFKVEERSTDSALLILFKDNHYEFIKGLNTHLISQLNQLGAGEREAFFLTFIDTDNHIGRSDRK